MKLRDDGDMALTGWYRCQADDETTNKKNATNPIRSGWYEFLGVTFPDGELMYFQEHEDYMDPWCKDFDGDHCSMSGAWGFWLGGERRIWCRIEVFADDVWRGLKKPPEGMDDFGDIDR